MAKVSFDGETRTIQVTQAPDGNGQVTLDVQIDLYSEWKDKMQDGTLNKYLYAFETDGGRQLTPELVAGRYFFIQNDVNFLGRGWRIKPYDADHEMIIYGNLYKAEITKPIFLSASGRTVDIRLETSSLTQIAEVGDPEAISTAVWEHTERTLTDISSGDIQSIQSKLDVVISNLQTIHMKLDVTTGGIQSIEFQLDNVDSKIDIIDGKIDGLATSGDIQTIETKLDTIDSKVSNIATSGDFVFLQTLVERILGLSQENFLVRNQTYASRVIEGQTRYFLASSTIKTYPTPQDLEDDINPLAEYEQTAEYDSIGRCILYKVEMV